MPVPNQPIVVQMNWTDTNDWPMWEQANANILSTKVMDFQIQDQLMAPIIGASSCRIVCEDPNADVVMFKAASALYPNVVKGRRGRVLERDPDNPATFHCSFFGYMSEAVPTNTEERPYSVTVVLESPLRAQLDQIIEVEEFPPETKTWDIIEEIFNQLGWLNSGFAAFGNQVREVGIPEPWGGGSINAGRGLTELLVLSGSVARLEYNYATDAAHTDWTLRVFQPNSTAVAAWSNLTGQIHSGSNVTFGER